MVATHQGLWVLENGYAGFDQLLAPGGHRSATHQATENRLAAGVREFHHGLGETQVIGHLLWCQDGQHPVDRFVSEANLNALAKPLRRGIANDVDRVGVRPIEGQSFVELPKRGSPKRRQRDTQVPGSISCQRTGAAPIGDDRDALTTVAVAGCEGPRGREQLGDAVYAHHTGSSQDGIEHLIVAHHGVGVAARRLGSGRLAPHLDGDHGLGLGRGAQCADKASGFSNALDVHEDAVGFVIVHQVVEHFAEVDVEGRPEGDHGREPNPVGVGPINDGVAEGSRLRHQGQVAAPDLAFANAAIKPVCRAHQTQAVGAEDAQVAGGPGVLQRPLACLPLRTDLREAAAVDDGSFHTGLATTGNDCRNRVGRGGDHRQVGRMRQRFDIGVRLEPVDLSAVGVHGENLAAEPTAAQVAQDGIADSVLPFGRADQGDRSGLEQWVQIVSVFHAPSAGWPRHCRGGVFASMAARAPTPCRVLRCLLHS